MKARERRRRGFRQLQERRIARSTERLLSQVFLELLGIEEFVTYLQSHWAIRPDPDPDTGRVRINVERVGCAQGEDVHGRAQS